MDKEAKVETGIQQAEFTLRGKPGVLLVVHQFAEKAKKEIRDKQAKKAKKAKEERDPKAEFLDARYLDEKGRECVPVTAIKKAIVTAVTASDNLTKVGIRQAVFVVPLADRASQLVPIELHDGTPAAGVMREDAVTIGQGTRGLSYRPAYGEWQLRVGVEFNPRIVSRAQLRQLLEDAGFGVGICEGRPEKTSALGWGRFDVV